MDEILQRLTEVSIRQQQITKYLAARQGQTEQELDALHTAPARRVLLPDPRVQVTQLLPKMTAHDDVEALCFLRSVWPSTSTTGSTNPASQPEPKPASYPISLNIGFWMGCPQRPRSSSTDSSVLSQGLTAKLSGSRTPPPLPNSSRPWSWRMLPSFWGCWGASAAVSPEGGPGAMRAGGHPATSRQTGGSRSKRWAHGNGGSNTSCTDVVGRLYRTPWPAHGGSRSGGKDQWPPIPSQPGTVLCPHSRSAWYSLTSSHPGKPQPSSRSLLCSGEW